MRNKKFIVALGLMGLFLIGIDGASAENAGRELTVLCGEDLSKLSMEFIRGFLADSMELKAAVKTFKDDKALAALKKEQPGALVIRDNIGDDGKFFVPGREFKMLALHGVAFIANGANPVGSISSDRMKSILEGKTIGWKELDGADTLINLYAYEKDGDSLLRIVKAVLPGLGALSEKALKIPDQENMKFVVSADRDAFGFISFSGSQMPPELRILRIDGVNPSFSGMTVRKYPFSRTIYVNMPEKPSADAVKFSEFITGRGGRGIIARNKMFPLIR